jgi:predicted metal-dependent hydrolase
MSVVSAVSREFSYFKFFLKLVGRSRSFDKKNIQGLVSIPKHISFKNGFDFAQENIEWLSNEVNKLYPLILIKNGSSLSIRGKKTKLFFEKDKNRKIIISENKIVIKSNKDNFKKILQQWLRDQILSDSRYYIKLISKQIK